MQQRLFLAALGHAYQSLHYVNKVTQERQSGEGKKNGNNIQRQTEGGGQ